MTLSTETNRIKYNGDDSTKAFSFPYYYIKTSDLVVVLIAADGTETVQVENTDYTVSTPSESGGTVTMTTAPKSTESLLIYRSVDLKQEFDPEEGGPLPADTFEQGIDKTVMMVQQLAEELERTVQIKVGQSTTGLQFLNTWAANKYFKTAANGVTLVDQLSPGSLSVTAFVETLLDDPDAATFLATLGFSSFIRTLIDDTDAKTARETLGIYLKGYRERPWFQHVDSDSLNMHGGCFSVGGDKVAWWDGTIETPALSSGGTGWWYICIDYSAIPASGEINANHIYWYSGGATWTHAWRGWYNNSLGDDQYDRIIFAVHTTAGSIDEFICEPNGNLVLWADRKQITSGGQDIDTDWVDIENPLEVPDFCFRARVCILPQTAANNVAYYWRTKGQSGTTGHFAARFDTAGYNGAPVLDVIPDGFGYIQLKCSTAGNDAVEVYQDGFYLPANL